MTSPTKIDWLNDPRASAQLALSCLDLTSLNDNDQKADIARLCERAQTPFGPVAAVCVWPRFAAVARSMAPKGIAVAAVANFPHGGADVESAVYDTEQIVQSGAQEVDVVLPYASLMAGDEQAVARVLSAVRKVCPNLILKVILETGELKHAHLIEKACRLSLDAGADFLKTSTGKTPVSATPQAARIILKAIASSPAAATRVGFKPSGGIRSVADAAAYIALSEEYLGAKALSPARFRIGASSVINDILAVLGGKEPPAPSSTTSY